MTTSGGSIQRRDTKDDEVAVQISPGMYSLDGQEWHEGDEFPPPWESLGRGVWIAPVGTPMPH